MKLLVRIALVVLATFSLCPASYAGLTIEQLVDIKHPAEAIWSPDGRRVAFIWDRAGVSNLYVVDTSLPGAAPAAITSFSDGQITNPVWSQDGRWLYFPRRGDLWRASLEGGEPKPVWTSPGPKTGFSFARDRGRVAYVRPAPNPSGSTPHPGADLVVRSLADGKEGVVAHDDVGIFNVSWSPEGSAIAYSGGSDTIRHDQTPEYSGSKIIYTITERTPAQTYVVGASGGEPLATGSVSGSGTVRWIDDAHFVYELQSNQYKKRTIYVGDVSGEPAHPVHEDVEEKFWSIPGDALALGQPSPDGKWIAFLSDRDGWDHIYVVRASGGPPVQITKGHFEAWRPQWSHDSTRIAFDANSAESPGDRHLGIALLGSDPAHATFSLITTGRGTNIAPQWSPDDKRLLYQHTDPHHSADLFMIGANPGGKPQRLTDSMPQGIDRAAFVEPELVHFAGADGQSVPGWLFVPKNLDRTKNHPAIVWIHGDGVNQNYDGWHVQRNYAVYYSFHQYLLEKGYVVFAPDYRGSIGYGRPWREGVYMDVGGKDAKDAWMSANYLKTLPYVDADRIGVWGLSYGGFFTLIAVTDQPTLFRAGVDVSGVADYAMYYEDPYHGGWTVGRIGTPAQNPQVYAQASPVSRIESLQRPLLVLHGTADVNVPFLHSVLLIDEALKKGKGNLVSFMIYPGEFHYFTRAHVLEDAWHRVDDFFAAQLKPNPGAP